MTVSGAPPKVKVLLATYNGAKFLDDQLASIASQVAVQIDMLASDDGSSDQTLKILENWRARWSGGYFEILQGPRRGFAENFRNLALVTSDEADYVAFSDQDDVWDPDKLQIAIEVLARRPAREAGLYLSRTRLIAADAKHLGFSPLFRRPPSFRNAVVQSIAGGNTIVFNRAGFRLFAESARRASFVTHDWWAYLICSGAGGFVYYDPISHIGYRQHANNLVGRNTGFRARVSRVRRVLNGHFASWTDRNLDGLERCSDLLTLESRSVVSSLRQVRDARLVRALKLLRKSNIHRQSWAGNIALIVAAALGKL